MEQLPPYQYIDNDELLIQFAKENQDIKWLGFDTEFVNVNDGPNLKLCLIQLSSSIGNYIIDPLKVNDLSPFLHFIENDKITKITHSGENDFRILYKTYNIVPKNIFDVQIAYGFISDTYPISFHRLLQLQMNVTLKKGFTVANWEKRPVKNNLLKYALDDVVYLKKLMENLKLELKKLGRLAWLEKEMLAVANDSFFKFDPIKEALKKDSFLRLDMKKQVFYIRFLDWKFQLAKQKNVAYKHIFKAKVSSQIIKLIGKGKAAFFSNRLIPDKVTQEFHEKLTELYQAPAKAKELEVINSIDKNKIFDPEETTNLQILDLIVQKLCVQNTIAKSLVMTKTDIRNYRLGVETFRLEDFDNNWRNEFLGTQFIEWMDHNGKFIINLHDDKAVILKE